MSLAALESSLNSGLLPVYVVLGDAGPLVEQAVARLIEEGLRHVGPPAFNHSSYRAGEADAAAPFATARTLPMMADRRLVVVRDMHLAPDAFYANFEAYLKGGAESSCVLVCAGERFPKVEKGGSAWGARIKKALKGVGLLVTFDTKDASPVAFAREQAARVGKQLGSREAELLLELTGPDLGRIQQEIEKLALYVGDAPAIHADDIHAACSLLAEAVIWDLTAGIATGSPEQALGALHRLQEGGDDPRRLLSMIVWQYRELLKMAELVRSGASDQEIRKGVRMRWDTYRQVRARMNRGFPGAADTLGKLSRAHRDMNSHRAGDQRVLEALVLQMLA